MMHSLFNIFGIVILLGFSSPLIQSITDNPIQSFGQERNDINKTAMLVLGCWAVGNILAGTYGTFKANGNRKYFHQFNAVWNVVNLGIAVFGYSDAVAAGAHSLTDSEILKEYSFLQSFLLLNAGLDLAYIMTGFFLKERSKNSPNAERLRGYGSSLFLQGGFLLLFDVALFLIHQSNADNDLYPHLERLLAGCTGIGVNAGL